MIKALAKYLLLLCVILLSGYGQLSARTSKESAIHAQTKYDKESENVTSDNVQKDNACIITSSTRSDTKKERQEICVAKNEVEEDEVDSSKKHVERNYVSLSNFYALSQECFLLYIKNSLTFCKRFSYFTSYMRYIIFQVIRI